MSAGIHPTSSPTPGRRERRKQEVRARILAAARELFAKNGFETSTVDEIARAADVVPATFFNHFQSKQALLGLMAGEVFETLHAMTALHLEGPGSSVEKLRRFIASTTESIASSRGVARDVFLEFLKSDATPDEPHPISIAWSAPSSTSSPRARSAANFERITTPPSSPRWRSG